MDFDEQRDEAEEAYWRAWCPACGTSPCEGCRDEDDVETWGCRHLRTTDPRAVCGRCGELAREGVEA